MSNKKKKIYSYPPQWCKYCTHYGEYKGYNACYYGFFLTVLIRGPELVPFDGWCNRFKYAEQYKSNQKAR